jgi:hypothetical protein
VGDLVPYIPKTYAILDFKSSVTKESLRGSQQEQAYQDYSELVGLTRKITAESEDEA